jgi:nicotinate-nucleotide--dimethylbenzimidazole phosphoribosyltransferase
MADNDIEKTMQAHLDNLTKPRGSLGKLEEYSLKMAKIQHRVPPEIRKKGVYVLAGDHGITAEGVSLYPDEVTVQMLANILAGGAGINALAGGTGWEVIAVDAGVKGDVPAFPEAEPGAGAEPGAVSATGVRFIQAKIGRGSRNFLREPAMSRSELDQALNRGARLAEDARDNHYDLVAIGDLGIGNTTTAAAMLTAAGFSADMVTDRGTGISTEMLEHKKQVVEAAVRLRKPARTGEAILEQLGSYDFAMMAGLILKLGEFRIGCVLDGFPVTAAAYMAFLINPEVREYLFAGHLSRVAGHKPLLEAMGLDPILSLDMRLGEGTGAVLGGHIVEMGEKAAREMASFSQAGVSKSGIKEETY